MMGYSIMGTKKAHDTTKSNQNSASKNPVIEEKKE